jgi:elongation factor P--(R)-beta-lysine ligase
MCSSAATDLTLHPIAVLDPLSATDHHPYYLQTSPEYAMKRLLAAGYGSIYQIAKAFRGEESGRLHNPEFTLLEWYRVDFDLQALMDEVETLLTLILGTPKAHRIPYDTLFKDALGIDPHHTTLQALQNCAQRHHIQLSPLAAQDLDVDAWLDILMTHCIEPTLGFDRPFFIHDYPASKAALAILRMREDGIEVAERMEVYVRGIELANGYQELRDATVQRQRFEADCLRRAQRGLPTIPIDPYVLEALEAGLPACSGIALGIDRLLLLKEGLDDLSETLSFGIERV